jgi:hypothetical protein
LDVLDLL